MNRNLLVAASCILALSGCGAAIESGDGGATDDSGDGETTDDASVLRSQEGHACSTNRQDEPQLVCTPAQDLVCISTFSPQVPPPSPSVRGGTDLPLHRQPLHTRIKFKSDQRNSLR